MLHNSHNLLLALGLFCTLGVSDVSAAMILDFDDSGLVHGNIVGSDDPGGDPAAWQPFIVSHGVTITVLKNSGGPDRGVIFDTTSPQPGPPNQNVDPDLRDPWAGGNLASPQTVVGNILVIADNVTDSSPNDGIVDVPNDSAGGGTIRLDFNDNLISFGFDWIDAEEEMYSIEFSDGINSVSYQFEEYIEMPQPSGPPVFGPLYDSTVEVLDHYANRIQPVTIQQLQDDFGYGGTYFNQVTFTLTGSGGFDTFVYEVQPIPEPTSLLLLSLAGVGGMGYQFRKRKQLSKKA